MTLYHIVRIVNIGSLEEPCDWRSTMTPPIPLDFAERRMNVLIEEFSHLRNELSIEEVTPND